MTALNFLLTRALARELRAGDEIVVTALDHDGNIAPWLHLQDDLGVVVRVARARDDLSLDLDHLASLLCERTRVVAFPAAANSVGTAPDVRAVVELAHEADALAWVDAVHYGPHGPIDVGAWDADVLICSPYKYFGPHMGLAYGRQELIGGWRPYKVRPAADEPVGRRFELGTCQHELLAGFVAAVDYVDSLGWDAIVGHERALGERFLAGLPEAVALYGLPTMAGRVPTFCFNVPGRTSQEVATHLGRARRGRVVGQLLRAGDDAPPRPRRVDGRRPRRIVHYNTPTRSTACSPGSASSCEAPPPRWPEVRRPGVDRRRRRRGHELTLFNRGETNPDLYPGAGAAGAVTATADSRSRANVNF